MKIELRRINENGTNGFALYVDGKILENQVSTKIVSIVVELSDNELLDNIINSSDQTRVSEPTLRDHDFHVQGDEYYCHRCLKTWSIYEKTPHCGK